MHFGVLGVMSFWGLTNQIVDAKFGVMHKMLELENYFCSNQNACVASLIVVPFHKHAP
jgi:hypothetical protein